MLGFPCVALGLLTFSGSVHAVTVTVSATASHPIPTTLCEWPFGNAFHICLKLSSGDGGLYAELLQNRAFQQVTPGTSAALNAWQAVNGAVISVINETYPVSSSLPNALSLKIPPGTTGAVGFANTGFYGIKVTAGSTYTVSFFYRFPTASSFRGNAVIGLQTTTGQLLASATAPLSGAQTSWLQVTVQLQSKTSPSSTSNLCVITLDGATGESINFAMLSLFPPTFKNRPNGMRLDIANARLCFTSRFSYAKLLQALAEMKPSFFRFPGGNNLEGQTIATRWQWNATCTGRMGDWSYPNTDGLGLFEYLNFCEDLGMQPIMAVWAGYALGGTSVAENQLVPYIQQAIDQINFVVGDPSQSAPAALRASLGHSAPFALKYVEIGNEVYVYRWTNFVNALKTQFPDIHFISTSYPSNPTLSPKPTEWDVHDYQTPTWFAQNSFFYDDFQRDGTKYFEGEYASISTNASDLFGSPANGRLVFPTMQSSSAEAAFMTGLERNSDIVFAASYAPLLNHMSNSQWVLTVLSSGAVYRSTSFYVQKFFSLNRGDEYLPSTLPARQGTLFWSIVRKTSTNQIIIKVSNTVGAAASLAFALPFATVSTTGTAQILTGAMNASNTPTTPDLIVPQTRIITTGKTFNYNAPGFSVSVLTFTAM
ncbi:alfa-L-arabinofuranosidase precursor [Tricholoma matsutake]|nr:alfa-L-arabinofuranosidase precursor [Tricholoma matsutake 945]